MDTYHFHYDAELAHELRDAINDRQKFSIEKEHEQKEGKNKFRYLAWDRICAIMDRLEDTLNHVNEMELGKRKTNRSAFDFYEFINCACVIIDCIKTMGLIFGIDTLLIENIEKSQDVFGDKYGKDGCDQRFFSYIRSLCVVHPLSTNHQKEFLDNSKFHCCPFVVWSKEYNFYRGCEGSDLIAFIYTSQEEESTIRLPLYLREFEDYLGKWVALIPEVIKAKENYVDNIYGEFKNEPVKHLDEFDGDIVEYLRYLKKEYGRRFGDEQDYIFDKYVRAFQIKLTDLRNELKLEKYKNAIRYSLNFLRNAMQNMSFEGFENTGIQFPEPGFETDLFYELSTIRTFKSSFSEFSYNLQKLYYLDSEHQYSLYDRHYARMLLEEPKSIINKYVSFTNTESDDEVIVLINLALYLDTLTFPHILNKNIPNEERYRENILNREEIEALHKHSEKEKQDEAEQLAFLEAILEEYDRAAKNNE